MRLGYGDAQQAAPLVIGWDPRQLGEPRNETTFAMVGEALWCKPAAPDRVGLAFGLLDEVVVEEAHATSRCWSVALAKPAPESSVMTRVPRRLGRWRRSRT